MTPNEFVNSLQKLAPSREDFNKYNLPEDYVEKVINSYLCLEKHDIKLSLINENDPLLQLLSTYDCSFVQIGLISLKETVPFAMYYEIGNVELDLLVLNKTTNEIEVRDHDSPKTVIYFCASSSKHFLETILMYAKYISLKVKDPSISEDDGFKLEIINSLTDLSGGRKFRDFYSMLLS
jgi:hypothetical protein